MAPVARYDPHVDWYEAFRPSLSEDEIKVLNRFLGSGQGRCLDLGCGTGAAIPELTRLGWTVTGVDLSEEMLARAAERVFDVELMHASAEALPFDDATFDAGVSVWTHTDVEDFSALLREAARVLCPGAPFVYIGAHPCFVGPHSRFIAAEGLPELHPGYRSTGRYDGGPAIDPEGLRARVGATHLPLGLFVEAFLDTGFRIARLEELGRREYPYVVALSCRKEVPTAPP
jgi:SAM-dependent methyltransferase